MENNKKKENKNFVYSIRINKTQRELLKKNEWIKKELDKMVLDFLKIYNA